MTFRNLILTGALAIAAVAAGCGQDSAKAPPRVITSVQAGAACTFGSTQVQCAPGLICREDITAGHAPGAGVCEAVDTSRKTLNAGDTCVLTALPSDPQCGTGLSCVAGAAGGAGICTAPTLKDGDACSNSAGQLQCGPDLLCQPSAGEAFDGPGFCVKRETVRKSVTLDGASADVVIGAFRLSHIGDSTSADGITYKADHIICEFGNHNVCTLVAGNSVAQFEGDQFVQLWTGLERAQVPVITSTVPNANGPASEIALFTVDCTSSASGSHCIFDAQTK